MRWIGLFGYAAEALGTPVANKSNAQTKDSATIPNDVVMRDLTIPFPPFPKLRLPGDTGLPNKKTRETPNFESVFPALERDAKRIKRDFVYASHCAEIKSPSK